MILLFGIVDAGRLAWEYNRTVKATQVGARVAVVTSSFPPGLTGQSYLGTFGGVTLTQGDRIPAAALGDLQCTRTACTCSTAPCPSTPGTLDTTIFDTVLLRRMQNMNPRIAAGNVTIDYTGSGLGYAGDPNGMQIAPLVTVTVSGMTWHPITGLMFLNFNLPPISTSLTAEDASGNQSN